MLMKRNIHRKMNKDKNKNKNKNKDRRRARTRKIPFGGRPPLERRERREGGHFVHAGVDGRRSCAGLLHLPAGAELWAGIEEGGGGLQRLDHVIDQQLHRTFAACRALRI